MSWANPTALWLLAAIVLLLFVRRRKPQRRLAVSNLYLWSAATTRDAPSLTRRFRRSLLLLLQAAFMASVIAAIARPLLSFGGSDVAVIIDVSMSMGARTQSSTRLEAAKARAVQLTHELPRGSRVHLWTAGATADQLGRFDSRDRALTSTIHAVQATESGSDLASAVARARQSDPAPTRIYVVTDSAPTVGIDDLEWNRITEPADNVALTRLAIRRPAADQSIEVLVAATNYGRQAQAFDAVITQNDAILARRAMHLAPGSEGSVVLTLPQTAGIVFARLEAADALAADNGRAVGIPSAEPLRVLLINGSHFVETALTTRPGTQVVRATAGGRTVSSEHDVIVCDGCAEVPADVGDAGVLVLGSRSTSRELAPLTVNVNARAHPLLELLTLDSMLVAPVAGDLARNSLVTIDDSRVIAHAAGVPVIVALDDGLRRVVELRFDPAAGFALESAFPMLLANCLDWIAAPRRGAVTLTAGDVLELQAAAANTSPVITGPNGQPIATTERAGAYMAQTERAGVYRVAHGDETKALIVNARVEGESDLATDVSAVTTSATLRPAPTTGWDAAGLLMITALALLAMEWRLKTEDRGQTT